MSQNDNDNGTCASGLLALLHVLLVTPLWYILLFHVLSRIDAATWVWSIFWVYVPLSLVFGIVSVVVNTALKLKD